MYKFTCNDENIITSYVGHTKDFTKRKSVHKHNCINEKVKNHNLKLYVEMRANGGWDNWTMTPLEEYKCDNKIQARIREQYHINLQAEKLNMQPAFTTAEEAVIKNRKTALVYYETHIDHIKAYRHTKFTCECGSIVCQNYKSKHIATLKHQQYILSQPIV